MAPNLSKVDRKRFLDVIHRLKKENPPVFPLKIRTLSKDKFKGYYGLMQFFDGKKPYFLITLRQSDYDIMFDSLIHEYAHLLCYSFQQHHAEDTVLWHDASWGATYARLYSSLTGESNPAKCSA